MTFTRLLLKPVFWVAFIVLVVIAMFLYGMSLVRDNTLLAQNRHDLYAAHKEIDSLKVSNSALSSDLSRQVESLQVARGQLADANSQLTDVNQKLAELTQQLEDWENRLGQCNGQLVNEHMKTAQFTRQLEDRENELDQCNGQLATKDQKIADLLRDLSTPHPYGRGQARVTVFKNCRCSNLRIWVDDHFIGEAKRPYSVGVCGATGAATAVVAAGKHRIAATDAAGRRWIFSVTVPEDACETYGVPPR